MTDLTTLKTLCEEMKVTPREARARLRSAISDPKGFPALAEAHKPGSLWQWPKASKAETEARKALAVEPTKEK